MPNWSSPIRCRPVPGSRPSRVPGSRRPWRSCWATKSPRRRRTRPTTTVPCGSGSVRNRPRARVSRCAGPSRTTSRRTMLRGIASFTRAPSAWRCSTRRIRRPHWQSLIRGRPRQTVARWTSLLRRRARTSSRSCTWIWKWIWVPRFCTRTRPRVCSRSVRCRSRRKRCSSCHWVWHRTK